MLDDKQILKALVPASLLKEAEKVLLTKNSNLEEFKLRFAKPENSTTMTKEKVQEKIEEIESEMLSLFPLLK